MTGQRETMKLLSLPLIIFLLRGSQSHRVIGHFLCLHNAGDSQSDAIISMKILLKKIEDSENDEDVFALAEEVCISLSCG